MEKEYIYEASSVEEALQKGLKDLALSEDKVKIDVIEGGSAGIFGLFKKEAKVKLTPLDSEFIKEEVKEVKVEEIVEEKQEEKVVEIETVKEEVVVENEEAVEEKTQEVIEKKEKREDYIVKNKDSIVSYLQNIVIAMGYADATVDFTEDGNRHFTLNIKTEENTSLIIENVE